MQNKSRAFTLIELLVVVLIIGILAAVAVPQYQTAVTKTRFLQITTAAHKLAEAQRRYHLANGSYTQNLDDLDIQIPGIRSNEVPSYLYLKNAGYCDISYGRSQNPNLVGCMFTKPEAYYYVIYSSNAHGCYSYKSDNYAADRLCKNLFGGEGKAGCDNGCHTWTSN